MREITKRRIWAGVLLAVVVGAIILAFVQLT
jgi:hypothetical protein